MSRAEYMRKYRKSKSPVTPVTRNTVTQDKPPEIVTPVTSIWHPEINIKMFEGRGRMSPVNGYVMVSKRSEPNGNTVNGVVTEADWRARLDKICTHGLAGWACKECLPA